MLTVPTPRKTSVAVLANPIAAAILKRFFLFFAGFFLSNHNTFIFVFVDIAAGFYLSWGN
jgi:hypothetical protein